MAASTTIPLVRFAVFEPFIETARKIGVPVEKTLRAVGLPTELMVNPELLLPEVPAWRFIQSVSRSEGIADFGLKVIACKPHKDLTTLAPLIAGCSHLYDLLRRFSAAGPLQAYSAVYALEEKGDTIWFIQKNTQLLGDDIQVQLFKTLGMIQLVQLAAGTDWRPAEIHFTFRRMAEVESAGELNPSRILFSQCQPSIAIPRHLLSRPLSDLNAGNSNNTAVNLDPIPTSITDGLRDAIIPYLGNRKIDKIFASDIIGLSPRTMQRRLAQQGTSYSQIIDQARLQRAAALLKQSDAKFMDISLMLGYENASTFTRAFRRWTGLTPREYRHIHSIE